MEEGFKISYEITEKNLFVVLDNAEVFEMSERQTENEQHGKQPGDDMEGHDEKNGMVEI